MKLLRKIFTAGAYMTSWSCLIVLCTVVVSLISGSMGLIPGVWVLWSSGRLGPSTSSLGLITLTTFAVCLACIVSLPMSGALARLALRTFPIKLGESLHDLFPLLVLAAAACAFLFWCNVARPAVTELWSVRGDTPVDFLIFSVNLCKYSGIITMWLGAIFATFSAHIQNSLEPTRPYLLFLRKFSTFADRVLIAEIIRSTPPNFRVALIASPSNAPANWDVFTWAFTGLRLSHPLRNLPLHFRTTDLWWTRNVEKLVKEARCIVIDGSGKSGSMQIEFNILERLNQDRSVVRLRLASSSDDVIRHGELPISQSVIQYKKTYLGALPGIAARLIALVLAGALMDNFYFGLLPLPLFDFGLPLAFVLPLYGAPFSVHAQVNRVDRRRIRSAIALASAFQAGMDTPKLLA